MRRPQRTEFLQQQRTLSRCISHDKIRISIALWEEEEESSSNSRDSLPRNKIKALDPSHYAATVSYCTVICVARECGSRVGFGVLLQEGSEVTTLTLDKFLCRL
ncbi:unnamed protein product [Sphagnum troendelagicum]|uniref:Uncharacterized protein n=1 Tax=Sphagnum troendelagicum TaxID=128251 RepID=A0ABP0V4R5_9BRYO